MKKLFLMATAATMLAACSQNEDLESVLTQQNAPQPVEFATYAGQANTRAGLNLTNSNLKSFGVFAKTKLGSTEATSFDFMFDQEVKYDATDGWKYDPLKYWPNQTNDVLSFYAYAPYKNATTTDDGTYGRSTGEANGITLNSTTQNTAVVTKIDYAKPSTGHTDVLWATPVTEQAKQGVNEKVLFKFNHAMARIGSAKNDGTTTTDHVTVRYLKDMVNEGGTLGGSVEKDASTPATTPDDADQTRVVLKKVTIWLQDRKLSTDGDPFTKFFSGGTLDFSDGTWTAGTGTEFTSKDKSEAESKGLSEAHDISCLANGDKKNLVSAAEQTLTEFNGILAIPNSQTAYIYAEADYYIITKDAKLAQISDAQWTEIQNLVKEENKVALGGASVIHNVISNCAEINLQANKDYVVRLVLGLTSVKVEADVKEWEVVNTPAAGESTGTGNIDEIDLPANSVGTVVLLPASAGAKANLTVSPDAQVYTLTFSKEDGSSIAASSVTTYTWEGGPAPTGITYSNSAGILTFSKNETTSDRTGTLTLGTSDGLQRVIAIKQQKKYAE